ncbi:MAG: outer membrane beta-barrel protein [Bacteroidota bacterium]
MKKVALLLITFILIVQSQSQAQIRFNVGVSTAMNSTFVLDKGLKTDPTYIANTTFNMAPIGFSFGMDITKKFGLSLDAIKAAQGQYYEIVDAYNTIQGAREFDMSYLQFPLLLKFMGGGDGRARMNFQLGPQLSLLQEGQEILKYVQGDYNFPTDPQDLEDFVLPEEINAIDNGDGTYTIPQDYEQLISGSEEYTDALYQFAEKELALSGAFGLTLDVHRNMYMVMNVKATYSLTDMRGKDLIDLVNSGQVQDLASERANLAVGAQISLHWIFGGTRFFKAKDETTRRNYMIKQ